MHSIKLFIKFIIFSFIDRLSARPKAGKKAKLAEDPGSTSRAPAWEPGLSPAVLHKKRLLLIRLDAIGDYILFRNFIEILKKSKKYHQYAITLAGNIAWKSIAEAWDAEYIEKFIWIDPSKYENKIGYHYKKLREIKPYRYDTVIYPAYSRDFLTGDAIAKAVTANEKIASMGDLSNQKNWQKRLSDRYYTKLVPANNEIMFEFYRNKEFFENLLQEKIHIRKPHIPSEKIKLAAHSLKDYAILFIGANAEFRKYSNQKFSQLATHIIEKFDKHVVLCGGNNDIAASHMMQSIVASDKLHNRVGKTSLPELIKLIEKADFMISNETSAPHFAVAVDTPVVVISNGNHFGRFTPYPRTITEGYYVVYHPEIEKKLDDSKGLSHLYGFGSDLDINEIAVEKIIEVIEQKIIPKPNTLNEIPYFTAY